MIFKEKKNKKNVCIPLIITFFLKKKKFFGDRKIFWRIRKTTLLSLGYIFIWTKNVKSKINLKIKRLDSRIFKVKLVVFFSLIEKVVVFLFFFWKVLKWFFQIVYHFLISSLEHSKKKGVKICVTSFSLSKQKKKTVINDDN